MLALPPGPSPKMCWLKVSLRGSRAHCLPAVFHEEERRLCPSKETLSFVLLAAIASSLSLLELPKSVLAFSQALPTAFLLRLACSDTGSILFRRRGRARSGPFGGAKGGYVKDSRQQG